MNRSNTIVLFDVDGTLTKPRQAAAVEMKAVLAQLQKKVSVGVVGGSDLVKIQEQLGAEAEKEYDFLFAENGLVYYKGGVHQQTGSIALHLGEDNLKKLINWILGYLSQVDVPVKRGTFVEFRHGMLNVSPVGRSCSQQERDQFDLFDRTAKVREKMVDALKKEFASMNLTFSIGGQISIDIFPTGWDKTYCLQYLNSFETVYFFGDKTMKGGNDYEIFNHERTQGTTVTSPEETMKFLREKFSL